MCSESSADKRSTSSLSLALEGKVKGNFNDNREQQFFETHFQISKTQTNKRAMSVCLWEAEASAFSRMCRTMYDRLFV